MKKIDIHYLVTIIVLADQPKGYQWMLQPVAETLIRCSLLENMEYHPPKILAKYKWKIMNLY